MITLWIVLAVVFLVLEGVTVALCSLWFAAGSLAALICALLGAPVWLQIAAFILVSAACLVFLYPLLKKNLRKNRQATNADRVLGQKCLVTERIDELHATGKVRVDGKTWSAKSLDGSVIENGVTVEIMEITGVRLTVKPASEK